MVNCVHPDILRSALAADGNRTPTVAARFRGIQANAACEEPYALDSSDMIRSSTPTELLQSFQQLHKAFPMKIYGGCCGTTDAHMRELAKWVSAL
jgi:methionine synthase I (cobalamin-dependent)